MVGNALSATDPVLRTPACAWWSLLVLRHAGGQPWLRVDLDEIGKEA